MYRSFLFALVALEMSGCGSAPVQRGFVECNSTDTCRAQQAERDHAFAKAVANEPSARRVDVEVVTRIVMVDVQRQVVYALDPKFVALDLQTGKERWHAEGMTGDSLSRAGMWLVAHQDGEKDTRLTFIDPAKPQEKPATCTPKVPIPPEAETVYVHPFDRGGQPYFYWQSAYHYQGGTPPGPEIEKSREKAEACGVMRVDPATCKTESVSLDDFLWTPPEGRRQRSGEKNFCAFLSPLRDIPAAAATSPHTAGGWGQLTPASRAPRLAVVSETAVNDGCRHVTNLTLEARNDASAVMWTHPLAPIGSVCGPP